MTPDEYAAIGRRVEERKHPKQPQGIGGQMGVLEPTQAEKDRAVLWELCERLIERLILWTEMNGATALMCESSVVYPSREAAAAALLEPPGGAA